MRVVVPFEAGDPKTRLAPLLDADERATLARVMLDDVLSSIRRTGHDPEVLATASLGEDVESRVPVTVDERPLSTAVNALLEPPMAIVMADLAIATPDALERVFDAPGDVAIVPGRGGGTNALVVRLDGYSVDYHGCSYRDHLTAADELGAHVTVVDSYRLSTDVDEREDLVEVLLHGEGETREWLERAGFEPVTTGGRVEVRRRDGDSGRRVDRGELECER